MDVTVNVSKVRFCKEYRIGIWNIRSMNQDKLEVVKREVTRVNIDIVNCRVMVKQRPRSRGSGCEAPLWRLTQAGHGRPLRGAGPGALDLLRALPPVSLANLRPSPGSRKPERRRRGQRRGRKCGRGHEGERQRGTRPGWALKETRLHFTFESQNTGLMKDTASDASISL